MSTVCTPNLSNHRTRSRSGPFPRGPDTLGVVTGEGSDGTTEGLHSTKTRFSRRTSVYTLVLSDHCDLVRGPDYPSYLSIKMIQTFWST